MLRLAVLSTLLLSTIYRSAAQYECPLIDFQQSLTINQERKLNDHSPSVSLEFINRSPMNLALLDVHYSINHGPMENVRLFEKEANNQVLNEASPLFMLEPKDELTYRFTYLVDGIKLSCDTPTYHVNGKQSLDHAVEFNQVRSNSPLQTRSATHAPATAPAVDQSTVLASTPSPVPATESSINQLMNQRSGVFNPEATDDSPVKQSTTDARMSDVTAASLNPGVCPLIPFEEKLARVSKDSNQYSLSFINQSPSVSLAYLDVHFSINNGPMANMRLYTDESINQPINNNERALDGLTLIKGDSIKYSFSYGVNEPALQTRDQSTSLSTSDSKALKIRACNTQVYDVKINE